MPRGNVETWKLPPPVRRAWRWQPGIRRRPHVVVTEARRRFWQAMGTLAPDVMTDLDRRVRGKGKGDPLPFRGVPEADWPDVAPLGPAVAKWATFHRIAAPWVIVDAVNAIAFPELRAPDGSFLALGHDIERDHGANDPEGDPEIAVIGVRWVLRAQSRKEVEAAIAAQLDAAEARAAAAGLVAIVKRDLDRDIGRVVRRLVLNESDYAILAGEGHADAEDDHAQRAARMAIASACDLLNLPPPARGRPKRRRSVALRNP